MLNICWRAVLFPKHLSELEQSEYVPVVSLDINVLFIGTGCHKNQSAGSTGGFPEDPGCTAGLWGWEGPVPDSVRGEPVTALTAGQSAREGTEAYRAAVRGGK